ncbi:solute carrier family 22 member 4-like isoform X1 [Clupea harengus]|uniref:Solute carrier family 22 member 4-like isoform X1 n=1 Tax=Clupea harengus TaxID=7950 RepID=A0A6P8GVZ6_CLUHA|nr:solute carrier family 22 member 4-like isoform X1 [Clupea harengus]
MREYDEIIAILGEWGPFQALIYILLSLSAIPSGYTALSMVFLADIPPHHCRLPFLNSSYGGLGYNLSIPTEEVKGKIILSRCRRYIEQGDSDAVFGNDTEGCLDGWVFSKERYVSTIVTEWNLVCDDAWKAPFTVTVFFLGVLAGSFCSGIISDRYGRKLTFFSSKALLTVFSLVLIASNSWEMFCVVYCFVGMMDVANYCTAFILGAELLSKSARMSFGILGVCSCFAIGYAILPLFAYFIRSWRTLQLALSLLGFLYIPLWWYVPESPRWLITQGRFQEAEAIIRAAAIKNGITPPDDFFQLEHSAEEKVIPENPTIEHESGGQNKYTWLDLLKTKNIRNITVLNIIIWISINIAYYGLSFNTSNLDGDPYLNCLIAASTEFVAYIFVWFTTRYAPRRFTLPFTLLLGGVLLLLIELVPQELNALTVALAMTGKLVVTGAFSFVYFYSTELFPTVVRNMGLGVTSMAARIGSTLSPYIAYIGTYNSVLPYILMGAISIISGVLSLLLPETKGEELPELISQVKPLQWLCRKKKSVDKNNQDGSLRSEVELTLHQRGLQTTINTF